ncbi:NAD(P)H-dependent flavin oxidoreductase [Stappia sp.]|uniref:NAD(P)H-dependent flavin oxidoreductase n=1 Tax=Stappia sp. TaxID=1870903 RepID=UPI003A993876
MSLPNAFEGRLKLPAIASPMFLASGPDLVVETCRSGVIGTFPALNQRSTEGYGDWLAEIGERLAPHPGAAPFGVNLIVHRSNARLEADLEMTVARKVPLVITSLGANPDVISAVHSYGGLVFHDVISLRHARKAAEAGVDGIIAVCAGAGGHAGTMSPFALVSEIRAFYEGAIILAGAINTGAQIVAARAMGADLAYLGTRFLATSEATIVDDYKQMILDASAADILYTPAISGVNANFLRPSIERAGLDPDNLQHAGSLDMGSEAKVWKNIWSAGQGTGTITELLPAAELCARLTAEYRAACATLAADPFA